MAKPMHLSAESDCHLIKKFPLHPKTEAGKSDPVVAVRLVGFWVMATLPGHFVRYTIIYKHIDSAARTAVTECIQVTGLGEKGHVVFECGVGAKI